jgi:RNA polymerase sigma factor (sigma-70 family)
MPTNDSVTCWIERIKAGDESAAAKVWNHFHARLIGLARRKLRDAPRRVADEEDVVAAALETFLFRVQQGKFPRLHDRDDLWHLLVKITERKALDQLRRQSRSKRGGGRLRGESAFLVTSTSAAPAGIDQVPSAEPTAEFAVAVTEHLRRLLEQLPDAELRQITLLKLEGYNNEEIAGKINRSVPTVERRLRLIRNTWKQEGI